MMHALLVFLAMVGYDFTFAQYTRKVADKKSFLAAINAVLIMGFAIYMTRAYVEDASMAVPVLLGSFVGTLTSVNWSKRT